MNPLIVGPRDEGKQYAWGDADRCCLCPMTSGGSADPMPFPTVKESYPAHDSRGRVLEIERDAKFVAVASGKYHTILLTESGSVLAFGDNTYGALAYHDNHNTKMFTSMPSKVTLPSSRGTARLIAASGYASFAVVDLPADTRSHSSEQAPKKVAHTHNYVTTDNLRARDVSYNKQVEHNHLYSWGRGDMGVLGREARRTESSPGIIDVFTTMRVVEISAGLLHVLVLTEHDGVFAFGDGKHGKLGLGTLVRRIDYFTC